MTSHVSSLHTQPYVSTRSRRVHGFNGDERRLLTTSTFPIGTLIPASIWTIIELDITIIAVCLIVSRPWLLKFWPSRLISTIRSKVPSGRRSSNNNKHTHTHEAPGHHKRWPLVSNFRRLDDTPPAVTTASLGAPFEFDVEKAANFGTKRETVGKD